MAAEGYEVRLAENSRQVLKWIYQYDPLDLLILYPDLPDTEETALMTKLQDRIPTLPVVLHTFLSEYATYFTDMIEAAYVEKRGSSVERLKQVVAEILKRGGSHPATSEPNVPPQPATRDDDVE